MSTDKKATAVVERIPLSQHVEVTEPGETCFCQRCRVGVAHYNPDTDPLMPGDYDEWGQVI